ncbi:MAG: sulfatase-like hydrolase/transferase [Dehalococcoidia bacterium]|jgi:arylsulfatase A-like enzyme|nr:sulfatase-like hydrolase/transferase [Dehalococcoidia bacterium]
MNVIVLMNDTFRRDHMGAYGNDWIQTPNFDRLASESAVFDRAYIAFYPTIPNRWDLATGRLRMSDSRASASPNTYL